MKTRTLLTALLCSIVVANGQQTLKLMSYNALNYGSDRSRDGHFLTVLREANPDVLVVQEMLTQTGVDIYLANILNAAGNGTYAAGTFINGTNDTENAVFYKADRITFLGNTRITTALRDINEFKFYHAASAETLRVFSLHLKASTGSDNVAKRTAEATILRTYTNGLPVGSNFVVTGDFNIYGSSEGAYQVLTQDQAADDGHVVDTQPLSGSWNSSAYAAYHTQSTRTAQYSDGGSTGGLDDRFDMMLFSRAMMEPGGATFASGSLTVIGNDGAHFDMAIGTLPNAAVSADLAYALERASDHLPITAVVTFEDAQLPVQLASFSALPVAGGSGVALRWSTLSETNNFGFTVEIRRDGEALFEKIPNGFVSGQGTTVEPHEYAFVDAGRPAGRWWYRLEQMDLDGSVRYSNEVGVDVLTDVATTSPGAFALEQNYPNPFNAGTMIRFTLPAATNVSLTVYDLLGHEVSVLREGMMGAGTHQVFWDGARLASGMYVYRLTAGDQTLTRRMVFVR